MNKCNNLIIVRGGGDLATGTIHRLWAAGFAVLVLEAEYPAAIRRQVSVCEAVYDKETTVEGMTAVRVDGGAALRETPASEQGQEKALHNKRRIQEALTAQVWEIIGQNKVPVLTDPAGRSIDLFKPQVVVDAILAKKNLGTCRSMAPLTIALGPGFTAGSGSSADVDAVVETKRGHNLGRIIREGSAFPNTGIPGNIGGYTAERVIHAPAAGVFYNTAKIGEIVEKGAEIGYILTKAKTAGDMKTEGAAEETLNEPAEMRISVPASITGILRGLLRDDYPVTEGFKIADIDPRKEELANCFTISDKSRCIAGSVLELCTAHLCGTALRNS